jgi:hypothetical protein
VKSFVFFIVQTFEKPVEKTDLSKPVEKTGFSKVCFSNVNAFIFNML